MMGGDGVEREETAVFTLVGVGDWRLEIGDWVGAGVWVGWMVGVLVMMVVVVGIGVGGTI